jgi:hypothetical protein
MKEKAKIADFAPKLQALCARTLADNRSREDGAEMLEAQLSALAFTMSVVSEGNPKALDELCHGANAYLIERCTDNSRAGKLLSAMMKGFPTP